MSTVKVRKRQRWSAVPDAVLENTSLSFSARLTLGWLLGREEGWEIKVGYMCRALGLTDKTWPKVRDELVEAGFYSQEKRVMPTGKIFWVCEVTDAPLYQSESIPPKKGDGQKTIPPSGMDGSSMDGNGGDYHTVVNHPVLTKLTTTLPPVDNFCQEKRSSSYFSLFLEEAGHPRALNEIAPQLEKALARATEQQARWAGAAWKNKVATGKIDDTRAYAFTLCQKAAAGLVVKPGKLMAAKEDEVRKTQDLVGAALEKMTQQQDGHGLAGKTVVFPDGARLKLGKVGAKIGGAFKPLSLIQKMIDAGDARIDEEAIAA